MMPDLDPSGSGGPGWCRRLAVCLLPVLAGITPAHAERRGVVHLGPLDLTPTVQVQQAYNDNIFSNDLSRQASFVTTVQAGGQLSLARRLNRYALTYGLRSMTFSDSPADDYVDHFLSGSGHLDFNLRNRLDFSAQLNYNHTQRGTFFNPGNTFTLGTLTPPDTGTAATGTDANGTGDSTGSSAEASPPPAIQTPTGQYDVVGQGTVLNQPLFITRQREPDQWHSYGFGGRYTYGRVDARGRIELSANYSTLKYDNNPERTAQWTRQDWVVSPAFYLRLTPRASLLTQLEYDRIEYPDAMQGLDGDRVRYLVGATWQQTAKTSGSARVGYVQMMLDDSSLDTTGGASWDVGINWRPLRYSQVSLSATQNQNPAQGFGTTIAYRNYAAGWSHGWSPRISTTLSLGYSQIDYQTADRVDNQFSGGVGVGYQMKNWLNLGLSYNYTHLDSNQSVVDYQQNVVMFSLAIQ